MGLQELENWLADQDFTIALNTKIPKDFPVDVFHRLTSQTGGCILMFKSVRSERPRLSRFTVAVCSPFSPEIEGKMPAGQDVLVEIETGQ